MKTEDGVQKTDFYRDDAFEAASRLLEDPVSILTNIMASMGDGLSIQDLNMRIVYQNKFMIDNFGPHIGEFCYNVYEKRSDACVGCPIMEAYQTGQVTKALRVGIAKDGTPFRFENIASVLRNSQGKIVAGIELCRMVEDREKAFDSLKKAMESLKATQHQLTRAEKLSGIGQLAAGVVQEINNPTAFAMSNLSMIQKYVTGLFGHVDSMERRMAEVERGEADAQDIHQGVRQIIDSEDYRFLKHDLPDAIEDSILGLGRIKTIIASLNSFASSSEGERSSVDINQVLESTVRLMDGQIAQADVKVVKNLVSLPATVANSRQLEQLFINLILNSIQALDPGGTITLTTRSEDDHIRIEVGDTGVGIPEDVIPNIFDPFFSTREVGHGVGLGLSIAYRIVESHNGSINVKSQPGDGARFTVRLPVVTEADS